jgi:cytochrome bd ubiquinol oxidase subunit II
VINAVGPFLLGNEVWLIAVAGVPAGAFPFLDGQLLARMYPLIAVLLVAWIIRDAGIWFRSRRPSAAWRRFWDGAIVAGSLGLALNWGVILGTLLLGRFSAPALLCGVALAGVFAAHGATFVALRLEGQPRGRVQRVQRRVLPVALSLVVAAAVSVVLSVHAHGAGGWLALTAGVALIAVLGPAGRLIASLPALAFGSAADQGSLDVLRWFLLVAIPIVLALHVLSWWTFGRRRRSGRLPAFF